ncbi:MAG: glucose 1-dehydrogenase [Dehalococcoidia bacterium]|nr:glucose 1-dehydrogenase [Dehalococcoidia bacterium]
MSMFDLTDRIAIVTGGNSGIGFAIAEGLAQHGARVIIANRDRQRGETAVRRLLEHDLLAEAVQADVSASTDVSRLVEAVLQRYGKIDILVNSAAIISRKPAEDFTDEDWDRIMNTNLRGAFLCCREAGRHMIERRKGKIINISSNVSQVVQPLRSIYCISKAGLSHLTRALGMEWAKYGVNVNAIGPGPTITELNKKYFEDNPRDLQERIAAIPMGRLGMPGDHVGAALYLASAASDYMTGQTLIIDGGTNLL